MVPRSVLMSAEVKRKLSESGVATFGNILGPQGFGWSNLYHGWLLGDETTLGRPRISSYFVRSFSTPPASIPPGEFAVKLEAYAQPPKRGSSEFGSFLYPVANSTSPPPLNTVDVVSLT